MELNVELTYNLKVKKLLKRGGLIIMSSFYRSKSNARSNSQEQFWL